MLSIVLLVILAGAFFNTAAADAADANTASALGLILLVAVVAALAGSAHYDVAWLLVTALTLIAFVPVIVALLFTLWAATRPSSAEPSRLMLHFAYGSNMHRAVMRKYAPHAQPLGIAALADFRFLITADGYASVAPRCGETVHGVLWRLTPRDRVTLDAWEGITAGRYRAAALPIGCAGCRRPALVYMARPLPAGRAKAGYMELVIAAAQEWKLPADYISSLQRWLPRRPSGGTGRERGEFRWT